MLRGDCTYRPVANRDTGTCVTFGTLVVEMQSGAQLTYLESAQKVWIPACVRGHTRYRGQDEYLQIFGITKAGLVAITISVFALWTCIALETAALRRAALDARDAQASDRTLERLLQHSVPASEPAPPFHSQSVKSS
jgi:hypothetical protein